MGLIKKKCLQLYQAVQMSAKILILLIVNTVSKFTFWSPHQVLGFTCDVLVKVPHFWTMALLALYDTQNSIGIIILESLS